MDVGRGRSLDGTLTELENIYLHELMKSLDANEGIRAFMEKRKPVLAQPLIRVYATTDE